MTAPVRAVPPLPAAEAELLNGLDPVLRSVALKHRAESLAAGLPFQFLSTLRNRSAQAAEALRVDRTTPAAPAGKSKHEVGGAYDLVRQGAAVERKVGEIGERLGLKWGGRFRGYVNGVLTATPDPNHFEAPVSRAELSAYRNLGLIVGAAVIGVILVVATEGE